MTKPIPRRPMTEGEQRMARALGRCRFSVGSFDKRFARDLAALAESPEPAITANQARLLRVKVSAYRRQIRPLDLDADNRDLLTRTGAETASLIGLAGTGNRTDGGPSR